MGVVRESVDGPHSTYAALTSSNGGTPALYCCPHAGGIYQIRLLFPDQYPEKPPKVKFVTEMFHPNSA